MITLDVDPCAGVQSAFVERVVAAELSGEGGEGGDGDRGGGGGGPAPSTDVRVTCRDGLVVVTVTTGAREPAVRAIDLEREAPPARPRVLSVAIAELVAASRAPSSPPPRATEPLPVPSLPADASTPPAPPHGHAFALGLAAIARGFPSLTVLGAGLSASVLSRAHVGARLDIDGAEGSVRLELGRVDARMGSVGARVFAGGAWRAMALELGAGLRGGVASLQGHADAGAVGHTFTGAWGGPFLAAGAAWAWAPAWSILVTAEGGWVTEQTAGLVAGQPGVDVHGPWWSGALGLAWSP